MLDGSSTGPTQSSQENGDLLQPFPKNGIESTADKMENSRISSKVSLSKLIYIKIQEIPGVKEELCKVEEIRLRMLSVLFNINNCIKQSRESFLAHDEDLERVRLRSVEFSARFKRNYFYRTKRQLQELKGIGSNPFLIKKKSQLLLVTQKLTTAHRSALHALQVIEKQMQKISVIGLIEELLSSYYCSIFELTFILKPFLGNINSYELDEVEKVIFTTMKTIRDLKFVELQTLQLKLPKILKLNFATLRSQPTKPKFRNSPLENRFHKKGLNQTLDEESVEQCLSNENGENLYIMTMKQKAGVKSRRKNLDFEEEPKTMMELLAEDESKEVQTERSPSLMENCNSSEMLHLENGIALNLIKSDWIYKSNPSSGDAILETSADIEVPRTNTDRGRYSSDGVYKPWSKLVEFRNKVMKYKKMKPTYSKKSIETMSKMAERLMDETLHESFKKIITETNPEDLPLLKLVLSR